jgi:hypothetical protein
MGTAIFLQSKWAPLHQKETRTCAQFLNCSSTLSTLALNHPGANILKQVATKQKSLSALALAGPKPAPVATRPATST